MADTPESTTPPIPELQARLQFVAEMLEQTAALDEEAREALAELVDELGEALQSATLPPAEVAQLAESTTHLAEALHHQQEASVVISARDRLMAAAVQAEVRAPVAVGLARRLVELLASIGI